MSWTLRCVWCPYYILVGDRGARGDDPGAGVEAADLMEQHVSRAHGKTWPQYREAAHAVPNGGTSTDPSTIPPPGIAE